ncbi:hypothetical protein OBO34_22245 [Clostridiales Family XIII bacterium ASD5510]|uniref:Uncharacterized protein n=1 Tax=Hominibacterium faecale TaxID=2839743 RepID=A0A9J6QZZ7_9FIRM|nr:hypothetical protein [Hominibacterium faecale]MCU7381039.1 hypothetical protein [Hominibacterium faecale]
MKIYDVHMPVAAVCLVKGVEAENEELAIKKAWRQLHDITSLEIPGVEDWEPYTEMVRGTYCAIPDPDAWADLTDELEELEPDVDWGNSIKTEQVKVKNAPAGFAEPDAGARVNRQVQDKPIQAVCQMEEKK